MKSMIKKEKDHNVLLEILLLNVVLMWLHSCFIFGIRLTILASRTASFTSLFFL
jgi:hypothetical protein